MVKNAVKIIEESSKVSIIESSEPKVSLEMPLFPKLPENKATIFSPFNFAITSPFFILRLKFIGSSNSDFFIRKEVVFFGKAVP